jgi:pimeloyl-ACP methyl ester carboxylesterase
MSAPTIVLVHGAFADASSWAPVTRRLLEHGHIVLAPPVYNRSLAEDGAAIRAFVEQIDGPVILAGHSYGGAVVTVAGAAKNVVGLVFVSAYVLDEGENIGQLQGRFADPELATGLVYKPYPIPGKDDGTDVSVDIDAFPRLLAEGIEADQARVLAVSQRPLSAAAFGEPASVASWKTTPGWGVVSTRDRAINPNVEQFGYERAGLRAVTALDAPHLVMLTHPVEVADVIETAVRDSAGEGR